MIRLAYAVLVLCVAMALAAPAQTLTTLFSFNGTDGASAYAGLIQATDGNLYGTTELGGSTGHNDGTVFKISPDGALTGLYSFCARPNCTDGQRPEGSVIQGADGNFYGTTRIGGEGGHGTIFRITPNGTLTTLYNFCAQSACADGFQPAAGLTPAANRDFYGTTYFGGAHGNGTVFRITPGGALTTLYSFCAQGGIACTDGELPTAPLIQAANGDFYGTTEFGGKCCGGSGTIFKITPSGTLTTLYSFCSQSGCADREYPIGGLVPGQ